MSKKDDTRVLAEANELRALLLRAGCDLYGFDDPDSASGLDRATGVRYSFTRPALRRIRELEREVARLSEASHGTVKR